MTPSQDAPRFECARCQRPFTDDRRPVERISSDGTSYAYACADCAASAGGDHPTWCAMRDDTCDYNAELWLHHTATRETVTNAGEALLISGEQYGAYYSDAVSDPLVLVEMVLAKSKEHVVLSVAQARRLAAHLIEIADLLSGREAA